MSETTAINKTYESLTPQRKELVDMVLKNLENGTGLWEKGWAMPDPPENVYTGKKYQGNNRIFLSYLSMQEGYTDNRWLTFKQMEDKGWNFKTDEEGKSLAKGKGAYVEFFDLMDKLTKKPFEKNTLDGMTDDEKDEYMADNVYSVRKNYRVFNGDLIEGIPQKEKRILDPNGTVERAENIIAYWNENESKIVYGGHRAFYRYSTDEVHLPQKQDFHTTQEYYGTALHEIGHSTGHEKRLNRNIENKFGTPEYAEEELKAEIASMFIAQDLEIALNNSHIENNSAYIQHWHEKIKENPNILFTAISDAEKISKFVMSKEKQEEKEPEHYAIVSELNAYDETVYKVYMAQDNGQIALAIQYGFSDKQALDKEFQKMQGLPFWKNSEFKEVTFDELQQISVNKAKTKENEEIRQEKSKVFMLPSEFAAKVAKENKAANMDGKGIESLSKMSDREVIEKASKTKNGEKFMELYNGNSVLGSMGKDERSLMARLAMYCNGDKEQLLRVFKSSGQYRADKKNAYYDKMANQSMEFISQVKANNKPKIPYFANQNNVRAGANAKA